MTEHVVRLCHHLLAPLFSFFMPNIVAQFYGLYQWPLNKVVRKYGKVNKRSSSFSGGICCFSNMV